MDGQCPPSARVAAAAASMVKRDIFLIAVAVNLSLGPDNEMAPHILPSGPNTGLATAAQLGSRSPMEIMVSPASSGPWCLTT